MRKSENKNLVHWGFCRTYEGFFLKQIFVLVEEKGVVLAKFFRVIFGIFVGRPLHLSGFSRTAFGSEKVVWLIFLVAILAGLWLTTPRVH